MTMQICASGLLHRELLMLCEKLSTLRIRAQTMIVVVVHAGRQILLQVSVAIVLSDRHGLVLRLLVIVHSFFY